MVKTRGWYKQIFSSKKNFELQKHYCTGHSDSFLLSFLKFRVSTRNIFCVFGRKYEDKKLTFSFCLFRFWSQQWLQVSCLGGGRSFLPCSCRSCFFQFKFFHSKRGSSLWSSRVFQKTNRASQNYGIPPNPKGLPKFLHFFSTRARLRAGWRRRQ